MNDLKNKYVGIHQPPLVQGALLRKHKITQVSIRMHKVGTQHNPAGGEHGVGVGGVISILILISISILIFISLLIWILEII